MTDSVREQIISAFVSALTTGSTGMQTVLTRRVPWWDLEVSALPAVCILEGPEVRKRFSYLGTTEKDMYSELQINVLGYQTDPGNILDEKRTDLIRDIENGIETSTTIDDLTLDVINQGVETDQGTQDNWAIVHCKYLVKYSYNHASP